MIERFYAGIGSRETPVPVLGLMEAIAARMASEGWALRTGGAPGADQAFARGAAKARGVLELYLPWGDFEKPTRPAPYLGLRLLPQPEAWTYEIAEMFHPAWDRLGQGGQKLMARNVHQVLGTRRASISSYVVCWTKGGKGEGGTGQALRIARECGIPICDLGTPERQFAMSRWLRLTAKGTPLP